MSREWIVPAGLVLMASLVLAGGCSSEPAPPDGAARPDSGTRTPAAAHANGAARTDSSPQANETERTAEPATAERSTRADETARSYAAGPSSSAARSTKTAAPDTDRKTPHAGNKSTKRGAAAKRANTRRFRQPPEKSDIPTKEYVLEDSTAMKMPTVELTHAQQETCRVKVGDTMPDFRLPDLDGEVTPLSKLRGERLTIVVFWTSTHAYAVEELADLGPLIVDRFGDKGVAVVAINEHDTPETVRQVAERVGADFPILIDARGTAFEQCATKVLPRTYLLDASGQILWFDIEYSRSTRRDLVQAIRFVLKDVPVASP